MIGILEADLFADLRQPVVSLTGFRGGHRWRKFDAGCVASLDDPVQWKVFDPVHAPLSMEEARIHQMLEVTLQCPLGGAAAIAGSV